MIAENIILIGGSITVAVALGTAIVINHGQSMFLYSNARLVGRNLFNDDELISLASSRSLSAMVSSLKGSSYHDHIEKSEDLKTLNMGLERGFIHTINEVKKFAPKSFLPVLSYYDRVLETKILRTIFRARHNGIDSSLDILAPIANINPSLLRHLQDTKTIADMKVVLRNTPYHEVMEKAPESIEGFDLAVQDFMSRELDRSIKKMRMDDQRLIRDIFRTRQDINTILTIIKMRIRDVKKDIPILTSLPIDKAVTARSMDEFVDAFSGTRYHRPLSDALREFQDNYYSFEKHLFRFLKKSILDHELRSPIGSIPLMAYLVKKEIEHKNLLIIAKGVDEGIGSKKIEEMLI